MNKPIGYIGRHTIYVHPAPDVQPGGQAILVAPADHEGLMLLCALTGATSDRVALTNCVSGRAWQIAHDAIVDQRLVDLVDLCAALRYAAPELVQLPLYITVPGAVVPNAAVPSAEA